MLREWETQLIVDLSEHFKESAIAKIEELPPLTMDTMDQMLDGLLK